MVVVVVVVVAAAARVRACVRAFDVVLHCLFGAVYLFVSTPENHNIRMSSAVFKMCSFTRAP